MRIKHGNLVSIKFIQSEFCFQAELMNMSKHIVFPFLIFTKNIQIKERRTKYKLLWKIRSKSKLILLKQEINILNS